MQYTLARRETRLMSDMVQTPTARALALAEMCLMVDFLEVVLSVAEKVSVQHGRQNRFLTREPGEELQEKTQPIKAHEEDVKV